MGHNRKEIRKAGVSVIKIFCLHSPEHRSIFKQQRWVISLKQSLNFCSTLDTTSTRMALSTSKTTRLSLRSSLVPLVSDPETTSTMRLSSIKSRDSSKRPSPTLIRTATVRLTETSSSPSRSFGMSQKTKPARDSTSSRTTVPLRSPRTLGWNSPRSSCPPTTPPIPQDTTSACTKSSLFELYLFFHLFIYSISRPRSLYLTLNQIFDLG